MSSPKAPWDPTGRHLVWDTEANGLLKAPAMTHFHCHYAEDIFTGERWYWGPPIPKDAVDDQGRNIYDIVGDPAGTIEEGFEFIAGADTLIAHHGNGFDFLAGEKFITGWKRPPRSWDSIPMAKVVWPYDILIGPDLKKIREGKLDPNLLKSHALKAWGQRLGNHKGDYTGGFDSWNPWMSSYMVQDVNVLGDLVRLIYRKIGWIIDPNGPQPDLVWPELTFEVECEVDRIIKRQEVEGIHFDRDKAVDLAANLKNLKAGIDEKLVDIFGSWWSASAVKTQGSTIRRKRPEFPNVTIPRISEKTGKPMKPYVGPPLEEITEGSQFTPIKRVTFSPSSRDHLGQRLQAVFGWEPKKFGANGKPTVDESTLEEIPESVMPKEVRELILEYFVVQKTLGTLAEGRQAWLNLVDEEGYIHGRMDTAGAVTRRGTHSTPNLSQVPSVNKEKVVDEQGNKKEVPLFGIKGRFGYECKDLFIADPGWELTDCDQSSLELIDLGHYLRPLDDGAFSDRVCDPSRDPHQEHADIAGILRGEAKTTMYLLIYGGSAYKLSISPYIKVEPIEVLDLLKYRGLPQLLSSLEKRFDANFVKKMDDMQKAKLVKARKIIVALSTGIVGLKELMEGTKKAAEARGWLKALDGSKVHVRKAHAALNTLLQSAGAITCKLWMVLVHRKLRERGLKWGRDFRQVLWVHDALTFTHRPGLGPIIIQCCQEAAQECGERLGLRGRYRSAGHTGHSWAETH